MSEHESWQIEDRMKKLEAEHSRRQSEFINLSNFQISLLKDLSADRDHWRTLALQAKGKLKESKQWLLEDGIHRDFWTDKYALFMEKLDATIAAFPEEKKP